MRKLKVNTKLAVRKINRLDNIDKGGFNNRIILYTTCSNRNNKQCNS